MSGDGSAGDQSNEQYRIDRSRALAGGAVGAVVALAGLLAVGEVSGFKALDLLEATLPTIRFTSAAIMGAAATILALMLTMLGLTQASDEPLNRIHYKRIILISQLSTIAIIGSLVVLMLVGIPLRDAESVPTLGYQIAYYAIVVALALLGGMMISVVLILQRAITALIALLHPDMESHIVDSDAADRG